MKFDFTFKTPSVPNFLGADDSQIGGSGETPDICIDVGRLSPEQVEQVIAEWAEDFRAHVAKRAGYLNAPKIRGA